MQYRSLDHFISDSKAVLSKGPIALIMVEDAIEIETTLRHHQQLGFATVVAFMPASFALARDVAESKGVLRVDYDMDREGALENAVNAVIEAAPGAMALYLLQRRISVLPFLRDAHRGGVAGLSHGRAPRCDAHLCR